MSLSDKLAQMKLNKAAAGVGTIAGAANLEPVNPAAGLPPVATLTATPAAQPAAPVQAAAPVTQTAQGQDPTITLPPWAHPQCTACGGIGFSVSKGTACRICDVKSQKEGKPQSSMYFIELLGDGKVLWMEKANEANEGISYLTGKPAPEVKATERAQIPQIVVEALKVQQVPPAAQAAPAAATIPAAPTATASPAQQSAAASVPPVQQNIAPAAPAADAAPAKRKRRTKEEMEADKAAGVVSSVQTGMVLVLNGALLKLSENFSIVRIETVFDACGAEMAKASGVQTYFDLDPFKRRDEFFKNGAKIAEQIGDSFVFCSASTPDVKALIDGLRPHASMIIVGTA